MPRLDGDNRRVPLGNNYFIRAPGVRGNAERHPPRDLNSLARSRSNAVEETALDEALASQGMDDVATIELSDLQNVALPAGTELRSLSGDSALELETPNRGEGFNSVVVAVDEFGGVTWNLPLKGDTIDTPESRGAGDTLKFRIPSTASPPPPEAVAPNRGLFGALGRKFLKVLVYPITDFVVGAAVDKVLNMWEDKNRPYRIRIVTPENYKNPDVPAIETNDAATWRTLSEGRALLFVHGTFSTSHSGFGGLDTTNIEALSQKYNGRLIAFDHFTLSHSPKQNVVEFLRRVPNDVNLDVDIVCHSRGGLVARELVERQTVHNVAPGRLKVGKVVFVGAANAGTVLTEPDHMVHMVDRFTSALNIFPDNFITTILEGLIMTVKVVGHGGLKALDGLAAMNPKGRYLDDLANGANGQTSYVGITADFEPTGTGFSKLALADGAMDRVFKDSENDLVVPTAGVFQARGLGFPLPATHLLKLDASKGVMHTTYFRSDEVRSRILTELAG